MKKAFFLLPQNDSMGKASVIGGEDPPWLCRGVTTPGSRCQKQRCNRCWSIWHRRWLRHYFDEYRPSKSVRSCSPDFYQQVVMPHAPR